MKAETLAAAVVFGWWGVRVAIDPIERLAWLPPAIFTPASPIRFLPRSLEMLAIQAPALMSLRALTVVFAVLAAANVGFRASSAVACVLLTAHQAILRGYGHVNHAEIPFLLAAWILCVFAWTDRGRREREGGEPLVAIAAVLCWSYSLTGIYRLAYGGLGVFAGDSMDCWAIDMAVRTSYFDFGLGRYLADYRWLALAFRFGLLFITAVEIFAPFCLVSRPFRLAFLAVMVPFHVSVLVVMNILFLENLILLLLTLVDWWRPVAAQASRPILLFDGECGLCHRSVDFILAKESSPRILFAASQLDAGRELMKRHDISEADVAAAVFLIEDGQVSTKAEAALKVAGMLRAPWNLASLMLPFARAMNPAYDLIARNRYRLYGRKDACRMPTPEERGRFL